MPNRIIRDGHLDSERVDKLSERAENFYSRLRLIVDDYGRFEYNPANLLSRTYPLRQRRYTPEQLESWLTELTAEDDPLVIIYQVGRKQYLQIQNFNQRIRKDRDGNLIPGKYPDPPLAEFSARDTASRGESREKSARATTPITSSPTATTPTTSSNGGKDPAAEEEARLPALMKPSELGIEGWEPLIEVATSVHMSCDPDPNSDLCQKYWRYLSFEERQAAIQGIIDRKACGQYDDPRYVPTLENYLRGKKWRESLRPRAGPQLVDKKKAVNDEVMRRLKQETACG